MLTGRVLRRAGLGYVAIAAIVVGVMWDRREPGADSEGALRDDATEYVDAAYNVSFPFEELERFLSARCRIELGRGHDFGDGLRSARALVGSSGPVRVTQVFVRNFAPPRAEANVVITSAAGVEAGQGFWAPFVFEGGRWVSDDC